MRLTTQLLLALLFLGLYSCKKTPVCDCFESAGSQWTETRPIPYFEQIVVNDNINVFISMGNTEQLLIEGGKNLTPNIGANVSNGVLTLSNNNICNWIRSYKKSIINVYITMPKVTYITNKGVGTIQSMDTITTSDFQVATQSAGDINLMVDCNSLDAQLFGSADLTLSGKCAVFESNFFAGTGFMYCDHLNAGYVYLSSSTTGDCYIKSLGQLDVVINKNGNVYYAGKPTAINKVIHGTGQLSSE